MIQCAKTCAMKSEVGLPDIDIERENLHGYWIQKLLLVAGLKKLRKIALRHLGALSLGNDIMLVTFCTLIGTSVKFKKTLHVYQTILKMQLPPGISFQTFLCY